MLQVYQQSKHKIFPGTNNGSDHDFMLSTKLKLKTKHFTTKEPSALTSCLTLRNPKVTEIFQAKIDGKLAALHVLHSNVDTLTNSPKEVLHSTADRVLGKQRKKVQPWVKFMEVCNWTQQLR